MRMRTPVRVAPPRSFASLTGRRRMALVVVGLAIVLSACGSSATTNTGNIPTPTPTLGASPTGTATPAGVAATATPTAVPPPPTLQALIVTQGFATINPGTSSAVEDITCPAGYLAVEGGFSYFASTVVVLMQDAPVNATTWRAQVYNGSINPIGGQQFFRVECLRARGTTLVSTIVEQSLGTIPPASGSPIIDAVCPKGYIVSGGGFISTSPTFSIMTSAPTLGHPAVWRAQVFNTDTGSPLSLAVRIMCLSAPNLQQQIIQGVLNSGGDIAPSQYSDRITPACPAGALIGGAGLDSGYPNLYEIITEPQSTTTWEEKVYNASATNAIAQVDVTCLKLG